jgi:hypothetical protein
MVAVPAFSAVATTSTKRPAAASNRRMSDALDRVSGEMHHGSVNFVCDPTPQFRRAAVGARGHGLTMQLAGALHQPGVPRPLQRRVRCNAASAATPRPLQRRVRLP